MKDLFSDDIEKSEENEVFTSFEMADILGYWHKDAIKAINTHKKKFEELGVLPYKSIGQNGTDNYRAWYELNKAQATLLTTYLKCRY